MLSNGIVTSALSVLGSLSQFQNLICLMSATSLKFLIVIVFVKKPLTSLDFVLLPTLLDKSIEIFASSEYDGVALLTKNL